MDYEIDDITRRLDELVAPYLIKDKDGKPIEEVHFPRRTSSWPHRGKGYAEWVFVYEVAWGGTSFQTYIIYIFDEDRNAYKELSIGLYMNDFPDFRPFGDDLEVLLKEFKARLDEIPLDKYPLTDGHRQNDSC